MAMAGAAVVGAAVLGVYTMSSGSTPVKSNAKRNQQRSKKAEPAPPPVVPQQKERSPAEQEALRKKRAASKVRRHAHLHHPGPRMLPPRYSYTSTAVHSHFSCLGAALNPNTLFC